MKQANPAGWTGRDLVARGDLESFDRLPLPIKRLFWFAPYDYATATAADAVRRFGVRRALLAGVAQIERDVARESARLYGEAQIGWVA